MSFMSQSIGCSSGIGGSQLDLGGGVNGAAAGREKQTNLLEVYKWKLAFDGYRDKLPQYYNDYINSYLKFLQMDQALLLPSYERLLFDQNRLLGGLVKELRQKQGQIDAKHENVFKDMKE